MKRSVLPIFSIAEFIWHKVTDELSDEFCMISEKPYNIP